MKKVIFGALAVIAATLVFTMTSKSATLKSLSADANATAYCTPASNDCKSSVTGNIYIGYKPSSDWEVVAD